MSPKPSLYVTRPLVLPMLCAATLATTRTSWADEATDRYPEEVIQWGVQKGETCEDIAKAVYGSAKHVALITRYNAITCTPGAPLKPGLTLVLGARPTSLPAARLRSLKPDVRAKPPQGSWAPAAQGEPLVSQSSVNTLDGARADIQFIDRTRIFMSENTLVIIYGTASRTAVGRAAPPRVEVDQGELRAALSALRGDDSVKPTVDVAIAGGGTVNAASKDTIIERIKERTTVAVFEGSALVRNVGKSITVPLNHGSRFVGKTPPSPPRPLPPAPAWDPAATPEIILGPKDRVVSTASWGAVAKARAFRVEVAHDEAFEDLVLRQEVPANVQSFRAERLPTGIYFIRVRAIDTEDYLGVATPARRFAVIEASFSRGAGELVGVASDASKGRRIVVSPYGVLELGAARDAELALDSGGFGPIPARIDFSSVRPQKLRLRVQGDETSVADVEVVYTPVLARLELKQSKLTVELTGIEGLDVDAAVAPVARITRSGAEGGATARTEVVALPRSEHGRVELELAEPARIARVDVVARDGAVLGTIAAPSTATGAAASGPGLEASELGLTGAMFALSPLSAPLWWSPTAQNQASLSAALESDFEGGPVDVQGQVFASGRIGPVGLEAMVRTAAVRGERPADASGWLGARLRALGGERGELELGAATRFGFPTIAEGPPLRLEAAIGIGSEVSRWSWLVDAGSRLALDEDVAGAYAMPFFVVGGGTFQVSDWLRAAASLDAAVVFDRPTAPCVACSDDSAHPGGGLTIAAEAGTTLFGGVAARLSPFDAPFGGVSAQATFGIRGGR